MKWMLTGAAITLFTTAFTGVATASVCSTTCNESYNQCTAANGGNAQQVCMPGWMQCKKACIAPVKTPTKVSDITPKPKAKTGG